MRGVLSEERGALAGAKAPHPAAAVAAAEAGDAISTPAELLRRALTH